MTQNRIRCNLFSRRNDETRVHPPGNGGINYDRAAGRPLVRIIILLVLHGHTQVYFAFCTTYYAEVTSKYTVGPRCKTLPMRIQT